MGQIIHPNQLQSILTTLDEEEDVSESMNAALRFLEGIDHEENSFRRRRRRRAERTADTAVSSIAARAFVAR